MRAKYKRILTFIAILIGINIFIGIAYLFYDKVLNNDTMVLVEGELSINFISGNKISADGIYTFSITNNGTHDVYFDIILDKLKNFEEKIRYNLISTEASVNIVNASFDQEQNNLASTILIKAGVTQNFTFKLSNNTLTSFEISIKKVEEAEEYFYSTILKNNSVNKSSKTKIGEDLAKENEGLIEDFDDYGITYYFRGNVPNNYVKINNNLWRIVRINGNGTVKLVINEPLSDLSSYNETVDNYEDLSTASISKFLTSFYENYLSTVDTYIANSKFCSENGKVANDKGFTYNTYERLAINKIPTFNCLGNTYTSKIGMLTADEVVFAGANLTDDNKEFYLYNSKFENIWWTSSLALINNNIFYPMSVSVEGKLVTNVSGTLNRNARPSINVARKVVVTGDGTITKPYEFV